MLRKVSLAIMVLALVAATTISTAAPADARGGRAAGIIAGTAIGLGLMGAYAAGQGDYGYRDYCYEGRRRCEVVGERCRYNRFGEYRCRDELRCWRPRYCD